MGTGTGGETLARAGVADGGFTRVVCGVDGRRTGFETARQAARLAAPGGSLTLVAVVELYTALSGRWGAEPPRWRVGTARERPLEEAVAEMSVRARESLAWAERQVAEAGPARVTSAVVEGDVYEGLMDASEEHRATLIAVGAHDNGRLRSAAMAEVTALVMHDAPTSVLIARPAFDPSRFPARIVVGIDGSAESAAALATAAALRERAGAALTVVTAGGDQEAALALLDGFAAPYDHVATPGGPVEAVVREAQTAELTVVGSRGLRGARALGSVSERVAFRADSSVLIVRTSGDD